jgi:cephalosporin hydroxylase
MIQIDSDTIRIRQPDGSYVQHGIGTPEAFKILTDVWLRSGWDTKYVYGFSWLGRPIIQLPEDMLRIQEVIYAVKPTLIIETGIAHGGSLIFYASLFKAMGEGRVIGVDVEIRPANRKAIEAHELSPFIAMYEGSSVAPDILERVAAEVQPTDRVMVMLDSNHSYRHVLAELRAYGPLVTPGSYIIAMDGIMQQVAGAPRTEPDWDTNNPLTAIDEFITESPAFVVEEPPFPFNEGRITQRVTYWPRAYLKRNN